MANVKRKKKTDSQNDILRRNAGISIILIVCACIVLFILGGTVWSQNINYNFNKKTNSQLKAEVSTDDIKNEINSLNERKLFDSTYYDALDNLSDLAYNTKWLQLCHNSQTKIKNELYVKVCDSRFSSKSDILYYYENILVKDLTSKIIDNYFIDYNGELYVKPFVVDKDANYIGMDSYTIKFKTNDKISFVVKSKYKGSNSNYEYKEHSFEILKNGSIWVVSKFDLPL